MAYQNINQYNYPKLKMQVIYDGQDMCLASDEVDFNQEVVFSPYLIAQDDGMKLPVSINLNSPLSTQNLTLTYGDYNLNNVIVSENLGDFFDELKETISDLVLNYVNFEYAYIFQVDQLLDGSVVGLQEAEVALDLSPREFANS